MGPNGGRERYVDVAEAAEILEVSERRVRQLVNDGVLPARRVGKSWLIDGMAVERRAMFERSPGRPPSMSRAWQDAAALEAPWVGMLDGAVQLGFDLGLAADGDSGLRSRLDELFSALNPADLLHDADRRAAIRRLLREIDQRNRQRHMSALLSAHLDRIRPQLREHLADIARAWARLLEPDRFKGPVPGHHRAPAVYVNRSQRRLRLRAHPGILLDLSHRVVLSGARAGALLGADLVPDEKVEGYVLQGSVEQVADEFALQPVDDPQDANVLLHDSAGLAALDEPHLPDIAPRLIVACDMLESLDPRTHRAGDELLQLVAAAHELERAELRGRTR